ncbi:MAG: sialidase family protein [Gemmatimonadetes bacterium]|nr:sialidase family protein [Gemmatimonadota bacterium]
MRSSSAVLAFALLCAPVVSGAQGAASLTLAIEGRSNQNVTLAASGQFVVAAWSATAPAGTDLYMATSLDGGARFGTPVRVNSTEGEVRGDGEQAPRIALARSGRGLPAITVAWMAKAAEGTRVMWAKSSDGGKTFTPGTIAAGSDGAGSRGWQSIAADSTGRVFALWLDHRNAAAHVMPAAAPGTKRAEMPKRDPMEVAGMSQLYFGSLDGAMPARGLVSSVCYCCKTSLAIRGSNIYATWRHVFEGSTRDIAMAVSTDGGKTFSAPTRVSEDHWQIDGCPDNGPGLSIDRTGRVHVTWVSVLDSKPGAPLALYYANSTDGKTFTPRVRVSGDGAAGHAQVSSIDDGSVLVAWDETTANGRRVRLAHGMPDKNGRVAFKNVAAPEDTEGLYPSIATTSDGSIVAWVRRGAGATTIGVAKLK